MMNLIFRGSLVILARHFGIDGRHSYLKNRLSGVV